MPAEDYILSRGPSDMDYGVHIDKSFDERLDAETESSLIFFREVFS